MQKTTINKPGYFLVAINFICHSRLRVHFFGLLLGLIASAGWVANSNYVRGGFNKIDIALVCTYMGFLGLAPYLKERKELYLTSLFATGVQLAVVLLFCMYTVLPVAFILFVCGIFNFLFRILVRDGKMYLGEWFFCFFIFMFSVLSADTLYKLYLYPKPMLLSLFFTSMVLLGAFWLFYVKRLMLNPNWDTLRIGGEALIPSFQKNTGSQQIFAQNGVAFPIDEASLENIIKTLLFLKHKKSIPQQLEKQSLMVLTSCLLYKQLGLKFAQQKNARTQAIVDCINVMEQQVEQEVVDNRFLAVTQDNLSALMRQLLLVFKKYDSDTKESSETTKRAEQLLSFYLQAVQLLDKEPLLNHAMQQNLLSIVTQVQYILQCIFDDPDDFKHGNQFLLRYLPSVDKIVTEYIRLNSASSYNNSLTDALEKCHILMQRLVEAFKAEHGHLLLNDTISFTAELESLDTLLDMHGTGK